MKFTIVTYAHHQVEDLRAAVDALPSSIGLDAPESRIGRGLMSASGRVRVSVAPSFGALYIVPRLPEFFRRYPDVSVEVLVSNLGANLIEDGIDVYLLITRHFMSGL